MSISVTNLTKVYGSQKAVDAISFSAEPGTILGFLGPNGAGKSTTMKMLTCFIPQTSGEATVSGFNISSQTLEVRRNIGYLPENNPLYQDLYVKESLGFTADVHKIDNKQRRINEVIGLVGLGNEQHKKIGQLSKGYRQRVGLAQAILHDPKVLILDEPTSGLDPNQLIDIRKLIQELGKDKTVVLSTHIMQEVEAVCNNVIIINKGRIVADDSLQQLREKQGGKSLEDIFISLTN
ncbi:MAG: ATP-binding cassette protein [Sphingobacteriaceae bacterium]|jgi:ABC-2 type transport system ATP-binding protein|nr:ATP-binding cassette protein [Sphingobacteriaceae bacterium]